MAHNGDGTASLARDDRSADAGDGSSAGRTATASPHLARTAPPRQARLGEELPIFCERCGYSLNGLPQVRCGACTVLHFSCPECNHHQPINTLRPAFQRILGRLRALGLAAIVFLKLNVFGWSLFAWGVAGMGISYQYDYNSGRGGRYNYYQLIEPEFQDEGVMILLCFGFAFGAVGRMLLLRWRSGVLVGIVLAGLVVLAWYTGAFFRTWEMRAEAVSPFNGTVSAYVASAAAGVVAGAASAWGIWLALAHSFLPKRTAAALLAWQAALSEHDPRAAHTDGPTSVTA